MVFTRPLRVVCPSRLGYLRLGKLISAANGCERHMADNRPCPGAGLRLGVLVCAHIVVCCVSLVYIAYYRYPIAFDPTTFHVFYDPSRLWRALLVVSAFAPVSLLFLFVRFSFGYLVGFYFYTMVLSYLWLGNFSDLDYDRRLAGFSATASAVVFLLPALFIASPIRQTYVLSAAAFDRLLTFIVLLGVGTVAVGATFNFRIVAIEDIYEFRDKMESSTMLNYLVGMVSSALLPFAFAGFAMRKAYWRAGAVLILLLFFYPITFSKLALFTPFWLVAMLLLSKLVEARVAAVLSLLAPILAGILLISLFKEHAALLFSITNLRFVAVPAVAMDVYYDFFSRHDLTFFCQISFLKQVMHCPYQDQLSVVMEKAYKLGSFNASLFATEGIASVGPLFAPVAVFVCGLVIALGNRLSAGLPTGFILISGAIIPQILLNVSLTTVLLTHGAGLLFLLWYVTPRAIFEQNPAPHAPVMGDRLIATG
jgi:hypothetical protein